MSEQQLLTVEVVFVLAALVGVALWSFPAALLAGGVLGVLACERASARRAAGGQRGGAGKEVGGSG